MTVQAGDRAPGLPGTLLDADGVAHGVDFDQVTAPMLIGIYKSSCAASKVMMPMLERIYQRHATSELQVLGVAQDSPNVTRSFARRAGVTYPILIEGEEFPVSNAFDIRATPTVFVIGSGGTVTYTTMGFLRDQSNDIERAVADLLAVPFTEIVSEDDPDFPFFVPG